MTTAPENPARRRGRVRRRVVVPAQRSFPDLDTPAQVLDFAHARKQEAMRADIDVLQAAVAWAHMHPAESIEDAAAHSVGGPLFGREKVLAIAGEGAPLVAEFCIHEFAANLGLSTDAGRDLVAAGLELCHRLPATWTQVVTGVLPAWKARRIATMTMSLTPDAAAYVDSQVAPYAASISTVGAERVVVAAIARFDPQRAEDEAAAADEARRVDVGLGQVSTTGTVFFDGSLDLADALDLEAALQAGAAHLAALGSTESLAVRRAQALGALARGERFLDLDTVPATEAPTDPSPTPTADAASNPRPSRKVVLYVHLAEAALAGGDVVARVERNQHLVTVERVKAWCGSAHVTVKPVIDLADHHHADSYEVPSRLEEQVGLRDHHCVFPWCTRPATRGDCDHVIPHDNSQGRDGPTCSCNLAPLCRRHHRLKTHSPWTYAVMDPGTFIWTSPHRHSYLVDGSGTREVG